MGAWPRDGLVCFFSGTLGKTHPGKCISEAFWNVRALAGPEGSWPTEPRECMLHLVLCGALRG